jgi:hypothetical protein
LWLCRKDTEHLDALPSTTLHITFNDFSLFDCPLDNLPINTKSIYFGRDSLFRQPTNLLPIGLEEFIMNYPRYPNPTEFSNFPLNLKRLSITVYISQKIIGLPPKLEFFAFDNHYFEDPLNRFDSEFRIRLTPDNFQLPTSCTHIMITYSILANITGNEYPHNVNVYLASIPDSILIAKVKELYPFVQYIDLDG